MRARRALLRPTSSGRTVIVSPPAYGLDRSAAERLRHPVGVHLRLEPRHVVAQDQQIVRPALAVLDVIAQERLRPEAHPLEDGDGALLIHGHLRDDLLDAEPDRHGEPFLRQQAAESLAAHRGGHHHAHLRDVRGPAQVSAIDRGIAVHHARRLGQDRRDPPALDALHPDGDGVGPGDVAPQEQQVVSGERARERERDLRVGGRHGPQRERVAADGDLARIRPRRRGAHTERGESQPSISGHSRRLAFGPATRLTWPPFSTRSRLSSLPTSATSSLAAAYGTMWSCSAMTWTNGTRMLDSETGRPPSTSSFL